VVLRGAVSPTSNGIVLSVLRIENLKDSNARLVREDSTARWRRDLALSLIWLCYMLCSIIFYVFAEDMILIDALYVRIVTAFTVGYGDLFPVTKAGKVLNCAFIILDTVTIAWITSKVMDYLLRFKEKRQEKRENEERRKNRELEKMNAQKVREKQKARREKLHGVAEEKHAEEENETISENVKGPNANAMKTIASATQNATKEFWARHKLIIYGFVVCVFVVVGTLVMVYVEGQDVPSAFEWNFVTLSTVGYGNVTPSTVGGKVFACFYIIFGVTTVIAFATAIFEKVDEHRQRKFKEQVLRRALISEAQLLEFDVDGNGKIDKYEFLSKMLIETQEVEQSKIEEIMAKFDLLDADGSGEITTEELRMIEKV